MEEFRGVVEGDEGFGKGLGVELGDLGEIGNFGGRGAYDCVEFR